MKTLNNSSIGNVDLNFFVLGNKNSIQNKQRSVQKTCKNNCNIEGHLKPSIRNCDYLRLHRNLYSAISVNYQTSFM